MIKEMASGTVPSDVIPAPSRSIRRPRTPEEIIEELRSGKLKNIAERSGRAQDKDDGGGLETLRREGYM